MIINPNPINIDKNTLMKVVSVTMIEMTQKVPMREPSNNPRITVSQKKMCLMATQIRVKPNHKTAIPYPPAKKRKSSLKSAN